ncbi:MAG: hypothetical protein HC772_01940 [Leptolyngbyaceae cyanobacterium CRU_2_3]|nr:hypothetical protein [Leptolyngbyaceae cyanobacterium CRU_2_3]
MSRSIRPTTTIFLTLLSITAVIWALRGFSLLTFLPGAILWLLILLTAGAGVICGLEWTRR